MSASFPRTSEDRDAFRTLEGRDVQPWAGQAAQNGLSLSWRADNETASPLAPSQRPSASGATLTAQPGTETPGKTATGLQRAGQLETAANEAQGKASAAKRGEGTSKIQRARDSTQKLASRSKWGLSKPAGDPKTPGASEQAKTDKRAEKAAKKTGAAKAAPEEPKAQDTADLRLIFTPSPAIPPRADLIAVHDIDETLSKAWIYRKRPKRRVNDVRAYASAGFNSYDGEVGLGTAGSPAPGRSRPKQAPVASGKKKAADDSISSIERWLATSAKPAVEEHALEMSPIEPPPGDHGLPSHASSLDEEHDDSPFFNVLASVPEDDDATGDTPDDLSWRRRMRRRPTLPAERRRLAGRFTSIAEEENVPSVGEIGEGRRANDVHSDRQSSLDQGIEKRVHWLSDLDMLPCEMLSARIMCYTYKGVEKVASPWEYLTELAEDLVRRLIQKRTPDPIEYDKAPIVLIGNGFGALIVQRAMMLLAIASRTNANPTTDLSMIAGVVLLDAPAAGPDREVFPRSRSQEVKKTWTQDWLGKARNMPGGSSGRIDTFWMWNKFSAIASGYTIPILWHYSPMVPTPTKPAIIPQNQEVMLLPKQSTTSHRLSRFEGPNDVDFRAIVDMIKWSVVVKCAVTKSERLALCLPECLRNKWFVDLRDQLGRTALHLAVRAANPDAVKRLLFQGKASATKKDNEGRSALNVAVQEAVYKTWSPNGPPDPELQKVFTQIINLLIKGGARIDDKDKDGKTPWAYAEGESNQWIKRLKEKHLVIGSSSTMSAGVNTVLLPQPGPQRDACNAYDVILAEVFLKKKRERYSEVFNIDMASVYDVIYKGGSSVSQILAASRPDQMTEDKVRCRWIHVPANNEQWVHDLMVSMGIQDNSMGGQRHEGSRLIDRYMMPQARRYKHFHTTVKKTQPEPRPRVNRFGSTDSAATVVVGSDDWLVSPEAVRRSLGSAPKPSPSVELTRTEADAIVIFMPIMGFERHRHRKYLTHAFLEANNAMRTAGSRDGSPVSKARVGLKHGGTHRRDRSKAADSSDDGESSSDKESSRLYPPVTPRARAQAQVKKQREAQLLSGYLDSRRVKPVHCRRTLDQFSYYMLNSTEARDKSQVAYRWAKSPSVCPEPKNRPIVMVDQLWLWAFHDGTVITSFPSTWSGQEEFNLSSVFAQELQHNKDRPIIKSVEDLLHLILKTSVDFFRRKGPANCQFHECFQSSINNVSEQQGHLFDDFRHTTKRLQVGTLDPVERKREIEFLFSLDEETELLVEIMDIQDELTIVKTILGQQYDVLEKLLRLYPKKADEDADDEGKEPLAGGLGKGELLVLQNLVQLLRDQSSPVEARTLSPVNAAFKDPLYGGAAQDGQKKPGLKGREREDEQPRQPAMPAMPAKSPKTNILQNRDLMYETIGIVENNIRIVTDMLAYAEKVESSLENLLDLKQKHANGWEARFAREGSEESQRQGNIILVFTLVTVVFLPLSFITSFFALEIDIFPKSPETSENLWPVAEVTAYVFGFSAVIFIPLIALALYVNKLIANVKQIYKQLLKALKDPETALNPVLEERAADHDSDPEGTFANPHTLAHALSDRYGLAPGTKRSDKTNRGGDDDGGNSSADPHDSDDDGSYADLFGRYRFHRRVPLLRGLWRYRRYRQRDARRRDNRWKDTYVRDYPLRYYRAKVNLWMVRVLVAVLAYFGSEKHRRARERDLRRRNKTRRRRRSSNSNNNSSGSDSEASSSTMTSIRGDKTVARRDFAKGVIAARRRRGSKQQARSRGSGYWKTGSGLVGDGSRGDGMGSLERWSNQTRSRGSTPPDLGEEEDGGGGGGGVQGEKAGKRDKLAWLRMRRNLRAREREVDEEKEIGAAGRGGGSKRLRVTVDEL